MKKQIIAAAVAASVSAVALADVSISGAAQVNINKTLDTAGQPTVTHDVDIKVTGKTGNTTFVVDLENTSKTGELAAVDTTATTTVLATSHTGTADAAVTNAGAVTQKGNALQVKNVYMTTDLAGINVKVGEWYNGDSNLNDAALQGPRAEFSTALGSVNAKFAMEPGSNGTTGLYEMHLGADLAGVKVNYEQENQDNHKIMSVAGSLAGVDFSYVDSRSDNTAGERYASDTAGTIGSGAGQIALTSVADQDTNNEQNMTISTDVGGMKLEYQKMKSKVGTTSDGFFGTFASANLMKADGFGLTTSLAGNTVQIRNYKTEVKGTTDATAAAAASDVITAGAINRDTKIIVTRPLASGATAEFTYVTGDSEDSMDLEFRMAF